MVSVINQKKDDLFSAGQVYFANGDGGRDCFDGGGGGSGWGSQLVLKICVGIFRQW